MDTFDLVQQVLERDLLAGTGVDDGRAGIDVVIGRRGPR